MKINVLKYHHFYAIGEHDVPEGRARYLIATGIAEEAEKDEHTPGNEKIEHAPKKEKAENKPGNLPGAKKKK